MKGRLRVVFSRVSINSGEVRKRRNLFPFFFITQHFSVGQAQGEGSIRVITRPLNGETRVRNFAISLALDFLLRLMGFAYFPSRRLNPPREIDHWIVRRLQGGGIRSEGAHV